MIVRQYAPCSLGRSIICLGKQGEINALRVEFDVSAWMAMYPDATVKLMHFAPDRPQDNPVIPTLGVEGTLRVWIVGEEDTAGAGNGVIELLLIDERTGSTIKSATGYTTVLRSPSAGIEAQEPEPGYVRYDVDQSALLTDTQKAFARTNIDAIKDEKDPTVPDWAKQPSKPTYTASEVGARPDTWTPSASDVGADAAGTASGAVATHNTSGEAHADLRALIEGLTSRLNALADSDDTTLDQLSEIVAYIKSNKALIDAVTTGKVSTSDIVDNLTTNSAGKVLSAAQGVALKAMIDGIVIPTALPNPKPITINGQHYDGSDAVTVTTAEIDDTLTQSGKAADAKAVGDQLSTLNEATAEEVGQLKSDLGEFQYSGKFSVGSKYSEKDVSLAPQKGDAIFFRADENNSPSFLSANLFLYYTENEYDLVTISNIGEHNIFISEKNYIKVLVNNALSEADQIGATWSATVMSSGEEGLSGNVMLFYDLLDKSIGLTKTDIDKLKNDFISKNSKTVSVSKTRNNTYIDFPVSNNDKGFIFVSDTNASKFTAYDLYGHKTDDTFESIAVNITTIGNIYTYENSKGYDYYRIIFRCSAPSTADEYVSVVFTTDTEMTAYGIITRIFNDVDVLKSTSATQEQIADLDARMLKTEENVLFQRNILNVNNLVDGKFISSNGELGTNADYSVTDYEFVEPNASYTWYRYNGTQRSFGQYAFYSKNKKFISYGAGENVLVVPSNAYYVRISEQTAAMTTQNPIICKGLVYSNDSVYQNEYKTVVKHYVTREEIAKINIPDVAEADTLSTLTIVASNSKKNNVIGFEANFTTIGSVRIAHGTSYDANRSASIVVDATNIYLYDGSTNLRATYPHGLTMDKFITVSIVVGQTRTAKIILTTANGRFTQDNVFWGGCREDVTAQAVSGTFTNARLTWYVPDYNYDLWAFGDSYFDFWVADIIQNLGYHNFMSDGFGGRGSAGAFASLKLALEKATPKKILWCLGMNDPDTEDAINATWKNVADNLIELCDEKGIELILCTIPITPVTEHKYKNAYVKASGKRYVDVCHAVGADVSPEWYDGMRTNTETDKIHPTSQLGTRTIADYMIANVPELCTN